MKLELILKDDIKLSEAELIFDIAAALEEGEGFDEDKETALKLYGAAAKAGLSKAYGRIGGMLEDENPAKAMLYYKKGAGAGDVSSMVQLGCMFDEQENAVNAVYCFEMAAKAGDPEGMYRYGSCLEDMEERTSWLRKAADEGYIYAPRALAQTYEDKGNSNLALFWYRQGLELGDMMVAERIEILEAMNEEEIDVVIEYDDEETM